MSIGRNAPCPCGSGKKYKQCCLGQVSPQQSARTKKLTILCGAILAVAVIVGAVVNTAAGLAVGFLGLGAVGVWLWLFAPPPRKTGGADPSAINYGR